MTQPAGHDPTAPGAPPTAPAPGPPGDRRDIAPVSGGERVAVVDALRGFALLGILCVNIAFLADTIYVDLLETPRWTAPADVRTMWWVDLLAQGKFYSLFSLLFGYGFGVQYLRAVERGNPLTPRYLRRIGVLLLFGMAHVVFVWMGDILILYSLVGLLLLAFMRCGPRTLVIWCVSIVLAITLVGVAGAVLVSLLEQAESGGIASASGPASQPAAVEPAAPEPATTAESAPASAATATQPSASAPADPLALEQWSMEAFDRAARERYGGGSYGAAVLQRLLDWALGFSASLFIMPSVLVMFLLGLAFAKARVFEEPQRHRALLCGLLLGGCTLGLVGSLGGTTSMHQHHGPDAMRVAVAGTLAFTLGWPLLALGYAAGFVLLCRTAPGALLVALLAPAGRMALTNYLLQSTIGTLLFNGYGLGWFGQVPPSRQLLVAAGIFGALLVFSHVWMGCFRFGPAEWLWRSLTYGKAQPMRRAEATG